MNATLICINKNKKLLISRYKYLVNTPDIMRVIKNKIQFIHIKTNFAEEKTKRNYTLNFTKKKYKKLQNITKEEKVKFIK